MKRRVSYNQRKEEEKNNKKERKSININKDTTKKENYRPVLLMNIDEKQQNFSQPNSTTHKKGHNP